LPSGAESYLRSDNPKVLDLIKRYAAFDEEVTTPAVWTQEHIRPDDIAYFRGDNAWVWQVRGRNSNVLAYALTYYYLKSIDRLNLLQTLSEDNSFGAFTFQVDGRLITRDLLDSIAEIYFLDRHLNLSSRESIRVLDVGAGYGRLAHRMTDALPKVVQYLCTDAIPVSTFVCEYYLRFRGVNKAAVVPLDEIEQTLRDRPVDIAVNIHSFSECQPTAIAWWARLLRNHSVPYVMIIPNQSGRDGRGLLTNDGEDFLPLFERAGYRSVITEPKFLDPVVQEYGLQPSWHSLLKLHA
jgi:hypothetical protein